MINPISTYSSGYGNYNSYSMSPVSAISGYGTPFSSARIPADEDAFKTIKNPNASQVKSAGRESSPAECETCNSRKYQDGSVSSFGFGQHNR